MILAAAATGAALDGRDAEFKAAAATLDANSVDIAKAMGSVYGSDAEQAFLPLWRRHIGFAVDYTVGVAIKDQAKQQQAVNDLIAYTQDFGAFLSAANPNLPKSVVADLVKHHVVSLKEVIDAQAAKDYVRAYAAQRAATAHMQRIADPLAGTIVKQFEHLVNLERYPRRSNPAHSAPTDRRRGQRQAVRRPSTDCADLQGPGVRVSDPERNNGRACQRGGRADHVVQNRGERVPDGCVRARHRLRPPAPLCGGISPSRAPELDRLWISTTRGPIHGKGSGGAG